jgi:general secretion pathway protein D
MHTRRRCCKTACAGWALIMLTLILVGCANKNLPPTASSASSPTSSGNVDVIAQVREVDLGARFPQATQPGGSSTATNGGLQAQVFYGDGAAAVVNASPNKTADDNGPATTGALTPAGSRDADAKGYEMNFENAPIATVAKVILGDILHVGYTIDARVQGTVTLASGQPVPRKDVLYVLESALRVSNVALVREGQTYRLIPAAEAAGTGPVDTSQVSEPGYGITVVPLQFVSASTLTKLLDNFAAKPGMIRADQSRNLVIVQGNAADRQAAVDTVHDFDADWMRGQSVGIFPVSNSTPEPVIAELEKIVDAGDGGLSTGLVKLEPIARQNAILAVTHQPSLLKQVGMWVARLDKAGTAGTSVRVYRMRYGDAREAARLLNNIFVGSSDSGLNAPTNELAPGSGAMSSSSGQPNPAAMGQMGAPQSGFGNSQSSSSSASGSQPPGTQLASNSSGLNGSFASRFATSANRNSGYGGGSAMASDSSSVLQGVRIAADIVNNALLIYANQENYRIIERTLQQLDRPQLQVAIDATIAEVKLNDALNYGVQFFLQSQNLGLKPDAGSIGNNPIVGAATAAISQIVPGFNFLVGSQANPQAILDALHSVTAVKILSTPSIVVVDNQPATLVVGDQIPITTQTAISVQTPGAPIVNNIDYRNTGVILNVIPRINANGNVMLDIDQEISNVEDNVNATTLTPTVAQRVVKSSIAVASGQTVLLAGLISETQNNHSNGVPGLDRIPGLGILFSQNTRSTERDELIVFIRPQIIRNGVDAQHVAQELRNKMHGDLQPYPYLGKGPCCAPR